MAVGLHDAINTNYRLTYKQLDPAYLPDETADDLTTRRDAAANSLAKLLPPSFGRNGVLQLFAAGPMGSKVARWEEIHQLFSQPDQWLCSATTVSVTPLGNANSSTVVQVILGKIESQIPREIKIRNHTYSINVIRLDEGATGKPSSYVAKLPPVAELISASTVIVHLDRLDHLVAQWQSSIANLPTVDFPTRETTVRASFGVNYKNAMSGVASLLALRDAQFLPAKNLRDHLESQTVFGRVADHDSLSDPDFMYAIKHSGASAEQRGLVINDRTALLGMAESNQPLTGLFSMLKSAALPAAPNDGTSDPLPLLTSSILEALGQKLAVVPAIAGVIASVPPPPMGENTRINFEALLQAWRASPSELHKIALSLIDEEYATTLVTMLRAGAQAGISLDSGRVDALIRIAQKLSLNLDRLQLEIGIIYYLQHRDDLAEQTFTAMNKLNNDYHMQSVSLEWLALVKLRSHDQQGAFDCMRLSVQLDPKDAQHIYFYASHLDKAGDDEKAIDFYNRFLVVEPATPLALRVQKRIAELKQILMSTSRPVEPGF